MTADPLAGPIRCQRCGDVIGAYEPTVLVTPTGPHETSLAAEPRLVSSTTHSRYHQACFEQIDERQQLDNLPTGIRHTHGIAIRSEPNDLDLL